MPSPTDLPPVMRELIARGAAVKLLLPRLPEQSGAQLDGMDRALISAIFDVDGDRPIRAKDVRARIAQGDLRFDPRICRLAAVCCGLAGVVLQAAQRPELLEETVRRQAEELRHLRAQVGAFDEVFGDFLQTASNSPKRARRR